MCWQALIPVALSLAGGAVQSFTQSAALKRQDSEAARAIQNQARMGQQANQVVNQAIDRVSPTVAQPAQQQVEQNLTTAFTSAVKDAQDRGALVNNVSSGNLSSAYDTARATALASEGQDAVDRARLAAKIGAPMQARTLQGYDLQDLGNQISLISNAAQGQAGVDKMRIDAAARVNPYLKALGSITSGVGQGLMLNRALGGGASSGTSDVGYSVPMSSPIAPFGLY